MSATRKHDQPNITRLINDIQYHQYRYQILNDPVISDKDFDMMMAEFGIYQNKYPELEIPVGVKDGEILHTHPMLSMRSTYELDGVNRIIKGMGQCGIDLKLDGLAVEVKYNYGEIMNASTRGDGQYGGDVTVGVLGIPSVPLGVHCNKELVSVYGEVVIMKDQLSVINRARQEEGKRGYATGRNAASGILRSGKNTDMLVFVPYTVWEGPDMVMDITRWCKKEGFGGWKLRTMWEGVRIFGGLLPEIIEQAIDKRPRLDIEVDGLVVYSNDLKDRERLGSTNRHHNWQMALKFPSSSEVSTLLGVEVNVGRTGVQSPTAILEPVELMGRVISRATLSNYGVIAKKDLRIGDKVHVILAKDVIPEITGVVKSTRTGAEEVIEPPETCVCCGGTLREGLVEEEGKLVRTGQWYCTDEDCDDRLIAKWVYLTGRGVLNIRGLGMAMITDLVREGLLTSDVSSLYRLTEIGGEKRNTIELLVGRKNWEKVVKQISMKREIDIVTMFLLMDISHLSVGLATVLSEVFNTVEDVMMRHAEILEIPIPRFPEKVKDELLAFLAIASKRFVDDLRGVGVTIIERRMVVSYDKKVVVTGKLDSMYRKDMISYLNEKGYHVTKNVTKDTNMLVVGKKPSQTKIDKANRYGVTILSESSALAM